MLQFGPRASSGKADIHIVTGENGTGKSTILMALAALVGGSSHRLTGSLPSFTRRISGPSPAASIVIDDRAIRYDHAQQTFVFTDGKPDFVELWNSMTLAAIKAETHVSFGAFAYAGGRTTHTFEVESIREQRTNTFRDCLSFNPRPSDEVAQWILNTKAKEAFARQDNNLVLAERRAAAIRNLEEALQEVIGSEVRFIRNDEPLAVRLSIGGRNVDADVLPEGLRSILSWVGDLLMRLDRIAWTTEGDTLSRPFLLLLDEIDVHLHPAWQRRILPMVQRMFPNAQVIATTHSPLVVGSVSDAWVYPLAFDADGKVVAKPRIKSAAGMSYAAVLKSVFGVEEEFDLETEKLLDEFRAMREQVLRGRSYDEIVPLAEKLSARSVELRDIASMELKQLQRQLATAKSP